ncbi:MAG: hypothetical protein ACYDCK_10905 [Thermoplasmatota archaeon]
MTGASTPSKGPAKVIALGDPARKRDIATYAPEVIAELRRSDPSFLLIARADEHREEAKLRRSDAQVIRLRAFASSLLRGRRR